MNPKVLLHIEEIFPRLPVYHVGVGYNVGPFRTRYDFQPDRGWAVPIHGTKKKIYLGKSKKNIFEVYNFQKKLKKQKYFLGFQDCRHFSQNLLDFSYKEPVDVVNPLGLYLLFTQ